jgi:hypothetical protein
MGCFSGSSSKSTSEAKTAEQKAALKPALDLYGQELGKPPEIYPEDRVAPFSELQQKSLTGAEGFADYFAEPQTVGTPLFEETGQATKDLLQGNIGATAFRGATGADIKGATPSDVRGASTYTGATEADITGAKPMTAQDTEDYFTGTILKPSLAYMQEKTIPGIAGAFAGPGFFGAARSQEESQAHKELGLEMGEQWAGLNWDVTVRNQQLAESLANRRVAAAEAKAGRKLTAEEAEAVRRTAVAEAKADRRFAAAEAEAGRKFTAGESAADRSLATLGPAMAFGEMPAQEIRNNLEIAASKVSGLSELFGFGQAEQTQAQAELMDDIMRFTEENQITDPENLEILLTLLGLNFSRGVSSSTGPGIGYAATVSAASGLFRE